MSGGGSAVGCPPKRLRRAIHVRHLMRLAERGRPRRGPMPRHATEGPPDARLSPSGTGTGLASSSSRACRRAESLSGWPESIRLNSTTLASPSSAVTSDRVRPDRSAFRTSICWSAWAATWARWVTTSTCPWRDRPARAEPTAMAASPPTPASTSSKTITPGASVMARRMASMVRASSPPEADEATGSSGSPGLAPRRNSTWSAGPSPSTAISNRAEGMARSCRVDSIRAASPGAVARRAAATSAARRSTSARAASISASRTWARRSSSSAAASWTRASSAKARTSVSVSPYLRSSWCRSCRRPRMLLEAFGVVLPGLYDHTELGGQVAQVGHGRTHPRVQPGQRVAAVEGSGRLGQPVDGAGPLASRHRGEGGGCGLAMGRGGGQSLLLGLQPGVLGVVLDSGPVDLADLVAEEVDLAGPGPGVAAQGLGLPGEIAGAGPGPRPTR